VFSFWESFFCVGVCLGLIVLFRERFNTQDRFSQWMSRNSFTAYLLHTPLLLAVTLALKPIQAPPLVKFVIASLLAVPIVFAVSGFLRPRIPGLRHILS
jgi:glucans biosynthesis protein C